MRRYLAGVAAVAAALAGCSQEIIGHGTPPTVASSPTFQSTGPSEQPSPEVTTTGPTGRVDLPVKQDLELTGDDGTRATVHINSVRTARRPNNDFGVRPARGTFVIINVTIAVTAGTLPVNPLYFDYQAPDGSIYHAGEGNALFAGFDPELDSYDLPAGQRVRGNVVFDAKYGDGSKLLYESVDGEILGGWLLA